MCVFNNTDYFLVYQDYYVADTSEGQVMVCVTGPNHTDLYISEVDGFRFSLSLERIVYYNPKLDNHHYFR